MYIDITNVKEYNNNINHTLQNQYRITTRWILSKLKFVFIYTKRYTTFTRNHHLTNYSFSYPALFH